MDWPLWVAVPVLIFYAVPFWLRIAIAVVAVALIGAGIYRWVFG